MAIPLSDWVRFEAALGTVSNGVPCFRMDASDYLCGAVLDGHVRTRTRDGETISAELWRECEDGRGLETSSGMHIVATEVNRTDIFRWLKQIQPRTGRRPGRQLSFNWVGLFAYLNIYVDQEGLPERAKLVALAQEWFAEKYPDDESQHPHRNTIGDHIDTFLREKRKAIEDGI